VSAKVRRRRGVLLLVAALASGLLAASEVGDRVSSVERRVGPLVPVAVAGRDLRAGVPLRPRDLAVRRVPAAYVPRGTLASSAEAVGGRLTAPLTAGGYLTAGLLGARASPGEPRLLRRGERALELGVTGGRALDAATPGSRVDIVVSTEPRDGPGRSFVALERVELLALRPGAGGSAPEGNEEGASRAATATATLRVSLRQAVYLSAAENFAREVRLLPRPAGDRRKSGRPAVGAGDL
jgi:pilus assembly protein CpaB